MQTNANKMNGGTVETKRLCLLINFQSLMMRTATTLVMVIMVMMMMMMMT